MVRRMEQQQHIYRHNLRTTRQCGAHSRSPQSMLTKTTAESCLKSGNLKTVQIPNLHKHTQIYSLEISTRDIQASSVKVLMISNTHYVNSRSG